MSVWLVISCAKTSVTWWMHWQAEAEPWVKEWGRLRRENPDIKLELNTNGQSTMLPVTIAAGVGLTSSEVDSVVGRWVEAASHTSTAINALPNRRLRPM